MKYPLIPDSPAHYKNGNQNPLKPVSRHRPDAETRTRQRYIYQLAIVIILLLAFFLRVWRLPDLPPGLWYDEAYHGMDALWMAESGTYPIFFEGNNGREPLWVYLVWLTTTLWGNTPFALRWLAALVGTLTVPLFYRFARLICRTGWPANLFVGLPPTAIPSWLPLLAMLWLTLSWWHLQLSRAGFRPVLLPPMLIATLYYFHLANRLPTGDSRLTNGRETQDINSKPLTEPVEVSRSLRQAQGAVRYLPIWNVLNWRYAIYAGFFLGVSQYTYLPARLAPLIVVGYILLIASQRLAGLSLPGVVSSRLLWQNLCLTGLVSMVVFAPQGYFFWQQPTAFSSRTNDVIFSPDNPAEIFNQFLEGVSLFFGGSHELYRHHLPERTMLGWLEIPFFWLGLLISLQPAYLRRPANQLLWLGLGVMWLPALLAMPPVHALRPVGLLPFYYLFVTLGCLGFYYWTNIALPKTGLFSSAQRRNLVFILLFVLSNGLRNSAVDYFGLWADHPLTYQEYNGPLVDLTHQLLERSTTTDLVIPFHLYIHPTTRYLLHNRFPEQACDSPCNLTNDRPRQLLTIPELFPVLYVGNISESSAWVWLTTDATGQGAAYVSRVPRAGELVAIERLLTAPADQAEPFRDRLGRQLAEFIPLPADTPELTALFDTAPLRTIQLSWGQTEPLVALTGYDVTPQIVTPGQPVMVNLYWHSLTNQTFDYWLFGQLIDDSGQPINQWEGAILNEDMYRWRPAGILPTQLRLWVGTETPPGPYLVRLGFFDPDTGIRLPLQAIQGAAITGDQPPDQIHLGLFYVSPIGDDPHQPASLLTAQFGDAIELRGLTLPPDPLTTGSNLPVTLHWRAIQPTDKPYTVFLQLLNSENEVVAGWDSQPFSGLYPTHLWSPGERLTDIFTLSLPPEGLPPGDYRLISGFYDLTTGHRLPIASGNDFVELARLVKSN